MRHLYIYSTSKNDSSKILHNTETSLQANGIKIVDFMKWLFGCSILFNEHDVNAHY